GCGVLRPSAGPPAARLHPRPRGRGAGRVVDRDRPGHGVEGGLLLLRVEGGVERQAAPVEQLAPVLDGLAVGLVVEDLVDDVLAEVGGVAGRSEERRVGKGSGGGWWGWHQNKRMRASV